MNNYNFLTRVYYKLVLKNNFINNLIFDIEKKFFLKKNSQIDNHVFICGLARSGTTTALNILHNDIFATLKYKNMPFILGPNLFKKINNKYRVNKVERAHRDKITIDVNSPEAFEEVFWKFITNSKYILKYHLLENLYDEEIDKEFKNYINLILQSQGCERYLSKNNNNILRIDIIRKSFPNSKIIIIYREPVFQAFSLLNQHINFSKIHEEDKFSLEYMNNLGHYEFGQNLKTFFEKENNYKPNDINFWFKQWLSIYSYLSKKFLNKKNIFFINYEEMPNQLSKLFQKEFNLNTNFNFINKNLANNHSHDQIDKQLRMRCESLYNFLKIKSLT